MIDDHAWTVLAGVLTASLIAGCGGAPGADDEESVDQTTFAAVPAVGSCTIFPADNPWNTDVSSYPVHPSSRAYMATIAIKWMLHPGFTIPYDVVGGSQPLVPVSCDPTIRYCGTSDLVASGSPVKMPIPPDAHVQQPDDHHVLVVQKDACKLYELWEAKKSLAGAWSAGTGAIYDLRSNALHPFYKASPTAAGLPLYPGLVKYDEVASGAISHALFFSTTLTQKAFIAPATSYVSVASDPYNPSYPPMGLRLRIKKSYDLSAYWGQARVILEALKKYGMILGDNNSVSGHVAGAPDVRWNYWPDLNKQLHAVPASAFEAVYTGDLHK